MTVFSSIHRLLEKPTRSFFLFGPRGTGKSTWLKKAFAGAPRLDLLDASLYLELSSDPHRLESLLGNLPRQSWVVLDEVQKIPSLLDEVHRLMEDRGWRFALCGSSARKLRRGGANLLAGRALTYSMEGFSWAELKSAYRLDKALDQGTLPFIHNEPDQAVEILSAYVTTYLREELMAEGLLRNVQPFVRFLTVAGRINGQILNAQNIAREASVSRSTVDTYFGILRDTLLAHDLPAWRPGFKVRETTRPKFYWFDPGVARAAAGLLRDPVDGSWRGFALETLVYHEMRVFNQTGNRHRPFYYYHSPAGVEVDFIVETSSKRPGTPPRAVAIEVKSSKRWDPGWEKPMRSLSTLGNLKLDRMIGVYMGERSYHSRGLDILPLDQFFKALHAGEVF